MKKSLTRFTAPALAIGLAFSVSGGVSAAGPDASAQGHAYSGIHEGQEFSKFKGADLSHRLAPIENRIADVNTKIEDTVAVLESEESITFEEYFFFQDRLDSLVDRLNASSNQLEAVTKKFDDEAVEVEETELAIDASFEAALDAQNLLDSIDVVPEFPDIELPVEEPVTP